MRRQILNDSSVRPGSSMPPGTNRRKYLLTSLPLRSIIRHMVNYLDPIVGNWYRHLDKGQMFRVVAFDESEALIEIQHFDGDIEEVILTVWRGMDLEAAEPPEDWTGPMDDIERDDLGYTETAMSGSDWSGPLQETPREQKEAWEDTGSENDTADLGER